MCFLSLSLSLRSQLSTLKKQKEKRSSPPARRAHVFDECGGVRGIVQAGSQVMVAGAAILRVLRAANRDGFFAISFAAAAFLAGVSCENSFLNNTDLQCRHVSCGPS